MKKKFLPILSGLFILMYASFLIYQRWLFSFRFEKPLPLIAIILLALFGLSGIFMTLKQDWARKLAIGYALLQITLSLPSFAVVFFHLIQDFRLLPKIIVGIAVSFLSLVGYIALVYILTRRSIINEFQSSE